MKIFIIFSLIFISCASAVAQNNPNPKTTQTPPVTYGARGKFGIADVQLFDKYLKTIEGVGTSSKELLAEQSLKSYMMPPRKMGVTANADCYAIMSAMEFYVNLNSNYKDNLSPDFIRLSQPKGSIEENLSFLITNGTISAAILPYESAAMTPSVNAAIRYKITNYLKLFQPTTRPQQKLYDLRKAITRGNPVIVELQVTNEFKKLRQTRIWNAVDGDKTAAGTQYVVVVGYDENRKMVEVLNSWGREWASGGYVWISYEDFGNLASNGFVLLP